MNLVPLAHCRPPTGMAAMVHRIDYRQGTGYFGLLLHVNLQAKLRVVDERLGRSARIAGRLDSSVSKGIVILHGVASAAWMHDSDTQREAFERLELCELETLTHSS